ncbi:hypothetical protein HY501_02175 [Candidatus Woesearchaeota archaeon]|nr:hypothetical protein [Candidatus Woesearchaeota archaeon]
MTLEAIQQQAKQLLDLIYGYEHSRDKKLAKNAKKILESLRTLIREEQNAGH